MDNCTDSNKNTNSAESVNIIQNKNNNSPILSQETIKIIADFNVQSSKKDFVGNTMIDTLYQNLDKLIKPVEWDKYNLIENEYFLTTLHRPANVDDPINLKKLLDAILEGTKDYK